jgi:hypothetical protein
MTTNQVTTTAKPKAKKRSSRRVRMPRASAKKARDFSKYLAPGAALLGSGLLTATGIFMKEQLAHFLSGAVQTVRSQGASVAGQLDLEKLLAHVGLQKRHGALAGPALAVLAGMVAGSALTVWLLPMIKDAVLPRDTHVEPVKEPVRGNSVSTTSA